MPMAPTPDAYCVLVVDDDESVRRVTMRALETFGFATVGAKDGFEAVDTLRASRDAIHCAIVDMNMPGMNGEQTMMSLHQVVEALPVLLSTGYSAFDIPAHVGPSGFAGFLQKPYQIGTLADTVRAAIASACA